MAMTEESKSETATQGEAVDSGRGLVRKVLIEPLCNAGLKRGKGQSERALAESLEHLIGQLDHMSAENLRTLADVVMDHAAAPGVGFGIWPAEVLIVGWAKGMQPRPFRLHRIVTSWLASVEGPVADAGGYLVQLFRFLRRHCRPPTAYDLTSIKQQAAEDNRRLSMIADRTARGAASQDDQAWHAAYLADEQQARGFVTHGNGTRATMAQQQEKVA